MNKRLKSSRYITGFDGIRTLAVIGVILYHLLPFDMQGGFLGVPIFFVVSGYLITDLLVQEFEQNKDINIKSFYIRRMKRLYPALVTMIFATTSYITFFEKNLLTDIKAIIVTNLAYVYNWYQVFHHESYFDKFGGESPFTHLWSLSIEGQFYLLWSVIIVFLLKKLKNNFKIAGYILGMAAISVFLMAILYKTSQDPSRVYYGTDTRMFSILIGSALAFLWPSTKLRKNLSIKRTITLDLVGLITLVSVILCFFLINAQSPTTYRGGMVLFSFLSAILVGIVAHPGADLNEILTNRFFTWIGKRSYGIYLYQYPVMVFYENRIKVGDIPHLHAVIEIALILIISELSYRYIEQPLQHFRYAKLKHLKLNAIKNNQAYMGLGSFFIFIVLVSLWGSFVQPKNNVSLSRENQQLKKQIEQNKKQIAKNEPKQQVQKNENSNPLIDSLSNEQLERAKTLNITAVGDSVLADTASDLQKIFPNMVIDAKVGRQVSEAIDVLRYYNSVGKLSDTVLIVEGTNGPFTEPQIKEMISILGNRKIYWVNTYVPTKVWQNNVNDGLKNASKVYKNLYVINWYGVAKNHPEWFYEDNVHPNPTGVPYYANVVGKGILK